MSSPHAWFVDVLKENVAVVWLVAVGIAGLAVICQTLVERLRGPPGSQDPAPPGPGSEQERDGAQATSGR